MKVFYNLLNFRHHSFVKNVATLQLGSFLGNVIQALIGILLARLLQPDLFGVYSLAFGLAGLLGILLGAGSQEAITAIVGRTYALNDKKETKEALAFYLKLVLFIILISLVASFFAPGIAQKFYGNHEIGIYAAIIICAVAFSNLFFAISSVGLQVAGNIPKLTKLIVGDQLTRYLASLLFVFLGFGVFGAVLGHFLGAIGIFLASLFVWNDLQKKYSIFPSAKELFLSLNRVSIKRHLKFTAWVAGDRNLANLYSILPVILLGVFVSASEVTFFKLAFGFVNLVLTMLGPISVLLNVEFPKMHATGVNMRKSFIKVSLYSMALSIALSALAVVLAPFVFRYLYGESFIPSVRYVWGLVVYGALFGVGVGLGPMWRALNKVHVSILINSITLGIGIPLGIYLISRFGSWGAVVMVTIWFTVSHFASFFYLAKKLKNV